MGYRIIKKGINRFGLEVLLNDLFRELFPNTLNNAFNPASIILNKKEHYYASYTQTGEITISDPDNRFGIGASFNVPIVTNGSDINFPVTWKLIKSDYASDSATYS